MIKVVLIDLDNTLLKTDGQSLFARSLELIGPLARDFVAPEAVLDEGLAALQVSRSNNIPTVTFEEVFYRELHARLDSPPHALVPIFERFYDEGYAHLNRYVQPQPAAAELLHWLLDSAMQVHIMTDVPLSPAMMQQLVEGERPSDETPLEITQLHFSRPHLQYFEEILSRLDIGADEALVISNNLEDDIEPAIALGINTFWVRMPQSKLKAPSGEFAPDGQGTLEEFLTLARDEAWIAGLQRRTKNWQECTAGLLGTLAAIDSLLRDSDPALWTVEPAAGEWSIRDAICHLRDHESEVDQKRLKIILEQDNPFISATNYDPMLHAHEYGVEDARAALNDFASARMQTIKLIYDVPAADWQRTARHSIFGPTTFCEMVIFMAEHDRIHLRQMREALAAVMVSKQKSL